MKKLLPLALMAGFLIPVMPQQKAHAENDPLVRWRWPVHRIKFSIPKSFKVRYNKKSAFIAKGAHDVTIKIAPAYRAVSAQAAAMHGFRTYTVVKERKISGTRAIGQKGGFDRYIVFGKGKSSRTLSPVRIGILGLKSPKTGKAFYVRFWWFEKYNHVYNNLTYKIAQSVFEY